MKLRRGCGCPIIIVMVADLVFVVGSIISLIQGPSAEPATATRLGSTLTLLVMLCNAILCALLALGAFRGQAVGQATAEPHEDGELPEEGLDSDSGSEGEED